MIRIEPLTTKICHGCIVIHPKHGKCTVLENVMPGDCYHLVRESDGRVIYAEDGTVYWTTKNITSGTKIAEPPYSLDDVWRKSGTILGKAWVDYYYVAESDGGIVLRPLHLDQPTTPRYFLYRPNISSIVEALKAKGFVRVGRIVVDETGTP